MKILVVCNAGMSSSILVKKIAEHAKSIGEEASVQAVSSSSVADEKGKWDVCLVAPQIKYAVADVQAKLGSRQRRSICAYTQWQMARLLMKRPKR